MRGIAAELRRGDRSVQTRRRAGGGPKLDDALAQSVFPRIYASLSVVSENGACCAGTDAVSGGFRQSERLQSPQKPKAKELMERAQHSIDVTKGQQIARIEIATLLKMLHALGTKR